LNSRLEFVFPLADVSTTSLLNLQWNTLISEQVRAGHKKQVVSFAEAPTSWVFQEMCKSQNRCVPLTFIFTKGSSSGKVVSFFRSH